MILNLSPVLQTLLATGLTWLVTSIGASCCVLQTSFNLQGGGQHILLDVSLGFAAGVMLAASFWSLLAPALSMATSELNWGSFAIFPIVFGLFFGALFVALADLFFPTQWTETAFCDKSPSDNSMTFNVYQSVAYDKKDTYVQPMPTAVRIRKNFGVVSSSTGDLSHDDSFVSKTHTTVRMTRRLWLLLIAVTVHNIPEGLAVGIAFGGVGTNAHATFARARNLAIGIALQNFPEGLAVSLPLRATGMSFWKSFWYGQLSGLVEPIAGLMGCFAVQIFYKLQPFALGFAAGAMLFVVFDDVIPEAHSRQNGRIASISAMFGFVTMMLLEVLAGDAI